MVSWDGVGLAVGGGGAFGAYSEPSGSYHSADGHGDPRHSDVHCDPQLALLEKTA